MKKQFVFIVDSFSQHSLNKALETLGLRDGESYDITGAGGAQGIILGEPGERIADAEKLLVFMSTFHGNITPAIKLSKKIKEINPGAKIIFRSASDDSDDPIFDGNLHKDHYDHTALLKIVREFLETPVPSAAQ